MTEYYCEFPGCLRFSDDVRHDTHDDTYLCPRHDTPLGGVFSKFVPDIDGLDPDVLVHEIYMHLARSERVSAGETVHSFPRPSGRLFMVGTDGTSYTVPFHTTPASLSNAIAIACSRPDIPKDFAPIHCYWLRY